MAEWRIAANADCIDDEGELTRLFLRDGRGRWWSAKGLDVNRILTRVGVMGWSVARAAGGSSMEPLEGPPERVWLMRDAEIEAWAAYTELGLLRDMALVHTSRELVRMGAEGLAQDLRSRLDALGVPMTDDMVETMADLFVRRAAEAVLGIAEDGA